MYVVASQVMTMRSIFCERFAPYFPCRYL